MAAKRIKRGSGGARTTEPCIYQQALDRLSGEAGGVTCDAEPRSLTKGKLLMKVFGADVDE
jgi:hypothetical protein